MLAFIENLARIPGVRLSFVCDRQTGVSAWACLRSAWIERLGMSTAVSDMVSYFLSGNPPWPTDNCCCLVARRPGVYSKLHGLQNFREGLVSLEEGATMDTIVARIRSSLTDSSTPSAAQVARAASLAAAKVSDAICLHAFCRHAALLYDSSSVMDISCCSAVVDTRCSRLHKCRSLCRAQVDTAVALYFSGYVMPSHSQSKRVYAHIGITIGVYHRQGVSVACCATLENLALPKFRRHYWYPTPRRLIETAASFVTQAWYVAFYQL